MNVSQSVRAISGARWGLAAGFEPKWFIRRLGNDPSQQCRREGNVSKPKYKPVWLNPAARPHPTPEIARTPCDTFIAHLERCVRGQYMAIHGAKVTLADLRVDLPGLPDYLDSVL